MDKRKKFEESFSRFLKDCLKLVDNFENEILEIFGDEIDESKIKIIFKQLIKLNKEMINSLSRIETGRFWSND